MKNIRPVKLILAVLGIFLIGVGVAFNAATMLGNDAVGIIYDGIRSALGLTGSQLGMVSNLVNGTLITILFFTGRRYVNIGTLIYILPYGFFVSIGSHLYQTLFASNTLLARGIAGFLGCLFIYVGVAIFIAMDMGLDPFTGVVMVIRDKLKKEFKYVKIGFDITLICCGVLLGGKLGIITIITALTAGPSIQWLSGRISSLVNQNFVWNKKRTLVEE